MVAGFLIGKVPKDIYDGRRILHTQRMPKRFFCVPKEVSCIAGQKPRQPVAVLARFATCVCLNSLIIPCFSLFGRLSLWLDCGERRVSTHREAKHRAL
jgi:hypothetical protein